MKRLIFIYLLSTVAILSYGQGRFRNVTKWLKRNSGYLGTSLSNVPHIQHPTTSWPVQQDAQTGKGVGHLSPYTGVGVPPMRLDLQNPPKAISPALREKVSFDWSWGKTLQAYNDAEQLLHDGDTVNAVKMYGIAAKGGHAVAQFKYGRLLIWGYIFPVDLKQGMDWIRKSANQGYAEAQSLLGISYLNGDNGVAKDTAQAHYWCNKAALQDDLSACAALGDLHIFKGDTTTAIKHYVHANQIAEKRNFRLYEYEAEIIKAINFFLGMAHYKGLGTIPDKREALGYFGNAAAWGDVEAQAIVGDIFMEEGDSIYAVSWYRKAAENNHVGALYYLTLAYYNAEDADSTIIWGTKESVRDSVDAQYCAGWAYCKKEDYENAAIWWKKAAAQNDADACWGLAVMYENELNDSVAYFKYLQQAAKLNHPDALNDMGVEYLYGDLVEKDFDTAIRYFIQSIEAGCGQAYQNLGAAYYRKEYKHVDRQLAASYWKQGAEAGNPGCQYSYGSVLLKGKGVKKNKQEAIRWLTMAAQNGSEEAKTLLMEKGIKYEELPSQDATHPQEVLKKFRVTSVDSFGFTFEEE